MTSALPIARPLRWGILGCGNIACQFAADLARVPGNRLHAVASATAGKAAAFAAANGGEAPPSTHDDYLALLDRDDVDAVYIATTHERHHGLALAALARNKATLCEKPLCLNAHQARELAVLSSTRQVFCMEALWTRFIPAVEALLAELSDGVIGEPLLLQADFGIDRPWDPAGRMLNPALAGGALLDLGIYPLAFARLVLGHIQQVTGLARLASTGVDAQASCLVECQNGRHGLLMSALDVRVPHQARIVGREGRIVVDDFFHPQSYTVLRHDSEAREVRLPFPGHGYQFEIQEAAACIRAGAHKSRKHPLSASIAILEAMDALRDDWGLRYPGE
jgi:predicted dehydrogenase